MRSAIVCLGFFAMALSAQKPPAILQIVREQLKPGAEPAYGRIEEQIAQLCARMNCPNRYLALASVSLPREVWWLNTYSSKVEVKRVSQFYAREKMLTAAMRKLAQEKKGLTSDPVELMTRFRPDLSDNTAWRIGELQFAVVLEMRAPARQPGATFQAPDGRAIAFAAAASREEAERLAAARGPDARLFEVRTRWSLPRDMWLAINPELWKP